MLNELVLVYETEDVAPAQRGSYSQLEWLKFPQSRATHGWDLDSLGYVYRVACALNFVQRTLDPVEYRTHDTRSQFDRQGTTGALYWITNGQATCVFVNLHTNLTYRKS